MKFRLMTVSKNILLEGLNQLHGANLTLDSDVDQDTFEKVTKHNTHDSQEENPEKIYRYRSYCEYEAVRYSNIGLKDRVRQVCIC